MAQQQTGNLDDFLNWKASGQPGSSYEYCRGRLSEIVMIARDEEMRIVNRAVIDAYCSGWFELVQRREGPGEFAYLIVKRRKLDPMLRFWYRSDSVADRKSA